MSRSCHFDTASNDKFSVKFWIFFIVMFFIPDQDLNFGAPSRCLNSRNNWTSFRSDFSVGWKKIKSNIQNLTLNSSFDALSKWHDLHINLPNYHMVLSSKITRNCFIWEKNFGVTHKVSPFQFRLLPLFSQNWNGWTLWVTPRFFFI